jgi:hypothetical protein
MIFEKVVATSGASAAPDRTAPSGGTTSTVTGSGGDLESRIDEPSRAPRPTSYEPAALDRLMGGAPLTAMLHVEATHPGPSAAPGPGAAAAAAAGAGLDPVFINRGSVLVIERATDWPAGAAREALQTLVDPVWTRAHIGMKWVEARVGAQAISRLEGLETIIVAERGHRLFVANDLALLGAVLDNAARPASAAPAASATTAGAPQSVYTAGFRHGLERDRYARVMRLIDHAAMTGAAEREPLFFSENLTSLSDTLSAVDQASILVQDAGATVSQTVTYRLRR